MFHGWGRMGVRPTKGCNDWFGGNRMYSCCLVVGANRCGNMGRDGGNSMLAGSNVSSIGTGVGL